MLSICNPLSYGHLFIYLFRQNKANGLPHLRCFSNLKRNWKVETHMQSQHRWLDRRRPDEHQGSPNYQKQADEDRAEASQTDLHFGNWTIRAGIVMLWRVLRCRESTLIAQPQLRPSTQVINHSAQSGALAPECDSLGFSPAPFEGWFQVLAICVSFQLADLWTQRCFLVFPNSVPLLCNKEDMWYLVFAAP